MEADKAGSPSGHGYRKLCVDYQRIYEHQAAWLYIYGEWLEEIDHWDGNGMNNAIYNLRPATRTQNNFNSERETGISGLKGAYLNHRTNSWFSKIQLGGQIKWLGTFNTAMEAHQAFMEAVEKYHGQYALHNRPEAFVRRF